MHRHQADAGLGRSPLRTFGVPYYNGDFQAATWRTDGFMSLGAESEGRFTTVPFAFDGGRLELNAWTRLRGEKRVS